MRAPSARVLRPHEPRDAVEFLDDGCIGAVGQIRDLGLMIVLAPVAGGHVDPIDVGDDFVRGRVDAFEPADFPAPGGVGLLGEAGGDGLGEFGQLGFEGDGGVDGAVDGGLEDCVLGAGELGSVGWGAGGDDEGEGHGGYGWERDEKI